MKLHVTCLLAGLALLLGPIPSSRAAAHPSAAFAHQRSDLAVDPAVRWGTLPNGVRYALLRNAEPRGRASLRFAVTVGSLHEEEDQRGLAHFLEHLAFNGSTHFPPGTLVEYFQRLGMSFGGDTNAHTSFDETVYKLELPDTGGDTLRQAFTLFADYGGGLLLLPESIEKERGIILSEKRARDSVAFRQSVAEFGFMLPEARFMERLPIGLERVIEQARRDRFVDFYDTWYRPSNFIVVAVGDFDPDLVEGELVAALSPLQPRAPERPAPGLGRVGTGGTAAKLHTEPEAPAVSISISAVAPHARERDTAALRLARLPRAIATAILNRRLAVLAKQEGAPFLSASVSVSESYDFARQAKVSLTCAPANWAAALATGEQELRRAIEHGFQQPELDEVRAGMRNSLEQSVRTVAARRSPPLADALLGTITGDRVFQHPEGALDLYGPALERVTVEACQQALRDVFDEALGRRILVSGNVEFDDAERKIVATYAASRTTAVAALARLEAASFAYTESGPPGKVAVRREVADLGVTLVEFTNGVRLNLKPTDFEPGNIGVSIRAGGGLLTLPADKPGLAMFVRSTFLGGGLGRHSVDDLRRILAGRTVGRSFAIDDDAFVLSGTTNRADLLLQLQLLLATMTDPGYREEAVRQLQKGMDSFYTRLAQDIAGPLQTEVARLLVSGDSRFGTPARTDLEQRTVAEARAWLGAEFARGPVEIAIVGDFEPDAVIGAVAQTFGTLRQRSPKPAYTAERRVSFPASPLVREFPVPTQIPKGLVKVYWPATDALDARKARRFSMLRSVFQDRLRVRLREQLGGTYSPSAGASLSDAYPGYGYLSASATVEPERAHEVADAIFAVAAELASKGVSEDELVRAKQPALTGIRQSLRTNSYWLGTVLSAAQEFPQRLDWSRERLADYESISAAEISQLAAEFLAPGRASRVICRPAPASTAAPAMNAAEYRKAGEGLSD